MARIVFDLDGTLIDSAPDICAAVNHLLAQRDLAPISLERTISFIGNGAGVLIEKLRADKGLPDSEQYALLSAFKAYYTQHHELTKPYPNAVECLEVLVKQGHRVGLCTNKPKVPALAVLEHLGLATYFETVWAGDSLPQRKPDPRPLHAAFDALGDGPCLFVGDSEVDAETAKRASVPFLLFTQGYRKAPLSQLQHVAAFADHSELPQLVQSRLTVPH
ncbi:MAG: phosphoglycolate phosphatase [Thalassovita sp.]